MLPWPLIVRGGRDDLRMALAPVPVKPFSRQFIMDKLLHWSQRMIAADNPVEYDYALTQADHWLDELSAWHRR